MYSHITESAQAAARPYFPVLSLFFSASFNDRNQYLSGFFGRPFGLASVRIQSADCKCIYIASYGRSVSPAAGPEGHELLI